MDIRSRLVAAGIVSLAAGTAIGWMDSGPGWDDTGVTAVALVAAAGIASFVAGRVPWLWAMATGIWVPLFEMRDASMPAPLAALAFAGFGAAVGWLASRSRPTLSDAGGSTHTA